MTDLHLDSETIVTALLHDTVEDTLATIDDIEANFGTDVARLVDGVTKLSKIEQMPENERAAENLRKFLLAMSEDIRVLLDQFVDRLGVALLERVFDGPDELWLERIFLVHALVVDAVVRTTFLGRLVREQESVFIEGAVALRHEHRSRPPPWDCKQRVTRSAQSLCRRQSIYRRHDRWLTS